MNRSLMICLVVLGLPVAVQANDPTAGWEEPLPSSIEPYQPIPIDSTSGEPYPDGVQKLTYNQIRVIMIKQSIAEHPHCPCPYSEDRVGGQCGTECLYYRPGGFKIKCYMQDITNREVYFWKLKYATPWPVLY